MIFYLLGGKIHVINYSMLIDPHRFSLGLENKFLFNEIPGRKIELRQKKNWKQFWNSPKGLFCWKCGSDFLAVRGKNRAASALAENWKRKLITFRWMWRDVNILAFLQNITIYHQNKRAEKRVMMWFHIKLDRISSSGKNRKDPEKSLNNRSSLAFPNDENT